MTTTTTLTNVRPMGGDAGWIRIDGDRITATGSGAPPDAVPGETVIDGRGMLALSGFVNAHAHVDKSWWGQRRWVPAGGAPGVDGRIAHERAERDALGVPSVEATRRVLARFLLHGTTDVLSHVDVDLGVGLRGIEVVRDAAATFDGAIRVEPIAVPQEGVLRRPGVDRLLAASLDDGVRVIGGLDPATIDRDPAGQLDLIFDLVAGRGGAIDIHLHDPGELGTFQFELILERVERFGMQGRVTISHGFGLPQLPAERQARLIERMGRLDVAMATVTPVNQAALPLRDLAAAGVRFGLGTDGIRDLWSPFGDGDILRLVTTLARKNAFVHDADLELALDVGLGRAGTLPIPGPRPDLAIGAAGNVVLVEAATLAEVVALSPPRRTVIAHGHLIVLDGEPQPIIAPLLDDWRAPA